MECARNKESSKAEEGSSNLRSILAKVGHANTQIRVSALKRILFKLESNLITMSDLIHEREFILSLMEWFNQQDVENEQAVLTLLHRISEYPHPARYLNSVGAMAYLAEVRRDLEECGRSLVDKITDNLLHTSSMELPKPCDGISRYSQLYEKLDSSHNTTSYVDVVSALSSTIHSDNTLSADISHLSIKHNSTIARCNQLETNNKVPTLPFTEFDRSILQTFIVTSRNNQEVKQDMLLSLERIFSEYDFTLLISFHNFIDSLSNLISSLPHFESPLSPIFTLNLLTFLLNNYKEQSNLSKLILLTNTAPPVDTIILLNIIIHHSNINLQHIFSKDCTSAQQLSIISSQFSLLAICIDIVHHTISRSDRILSLDMPVDVTSQVFTHITECIQTVQEHIERESDRAVFVLLLAGALTLSDKLGLLLRAITPAQIGHDSGPGLYVLLDLACSPMVNLWIHKFRNIANPFLNVISPDTPRTFSRFLEVEDRFKATMELVRILNKIQMKKASVDFDLLNLVKLCRESVAVIFCHNNILIVECITEVCYWLLDEQRMGLNDDVIAILTTLLECYPIDGNVSLTTFHKLVGLIKLHISVEKASAVSLYLIKLLAKYSLILYDIDTNIWKSTCNLIFFLVTRIDNGMLFESIIHWIAEFQMRALAPEVIEEVFTRFSIPSEDIQFEVLKVHIRFCFHKDDEIRARAVKILQTLSKESVNFREEFLLNCQPPTTEHKVGYRVPFHHEDVHKILNIMLSTVLDGRIKLSAYEQLHVLLQDPKLHQVVMNEAKCIELIIEQTKNLDRLNVDFAHASIYSLRLLTQFNRNLTLRLSTDIHLINALLYWTQYTTDPTQVYNISKLVFLLVFIHSIRNRDCIEIPWYVYDALIIPFEISPYTTLAQPMDHYRDLIDNVHMMARMSTCWKHYLTMDKVEISKLIGKPYASEYKCLIPDITLDELTHYISLNESTKQEQYSISLTALAELSLHSQCINSEIVSQTMQRLIKTELCPKVQSTCFKTILKLTESRLEYSQMIQDITEHICIAKHDLCKRFKSLLDMVIHSQISPALLIEYRDYLHLYHLLAVTLSAFPNLHCHITYITSFTNTISSFKHDVIAHYYDVQLLLKSIGKLVRPNGQSQRFLCYRGDKLYLTLISRVKGISEDILLLCVASTNQACHSIISEALYILQCTLNVLHSAKFPTNVSQEIISVLTQLLVKNEEIQALVLSSLSVIAQTHECIDLINSVVMTIYGVSLVEMCRSIILDGEGTSALIREQTCYLLAATCKTVAIEKEIVDNVVARFFEQHQHIQSLYAEDRVKTALTVNLSLLAGLATLLTAFIANQKIEIALDDSLHLFVFYSDLKLLERVRSTTSLAAQIQLVNSLSTLIVQLFDLQLKPSENNTIFLYRTWSLLQFTNTTKFITNYKHIFKLIMTLMQSHTFYLWHFIQLLHSHSGILMKSMASLLHTEIVPVRENLLPLTVLSNVAENIRNCVDENPKEFDVYAHLFGEFFDSQETICNVNLIDTDKKSGNTPNGSKIAELILSLINKTLPISREFIPSDFTHLEKELSLFIHWSSEVCSTLDKCGFINSLVDELDSSTTKLYKLGNKSSEQRESFLQIQTKCTLLANIFNKLSSRKEACIKQGLLEIISKLWAFTRGVENLEKSVVHLLTVLTNESEKVCKSMSHPQGVPSLINDVTKRTIALLKRANSEKNEIRIVSQLLTLIGNTCLAVECRRFIQKIGLISELHSLLETTRGKKYRIPRLVLLSTLILLTKLNSYDDGRKVVFQYKEVLEIAGEIGLEYFKDKDILVRTLLLVHNQSFLQSSKSYILSNPTLISLLNSALLTQEQEYMDIVGNTISALLCNFNKGKSLLKKSKLIQSLRETVTMLNECKRENKYLTQAMLYIETSQSQVQYN